MLTREAPRAEEETLGELKLPSSGASPAPSKAASGKDGKSGGSTAPKKPIIEEISSTPAVEEAIAEAPKMKEPVYELIDVEEPKALKLIVELPNVAAVSELDVNVGDKNVDLVAADAGYALSLTLPTPVLSDDAKCKWDKKRHVLTLTMPVEPPAVVS